MFSFSKSYESLQMDILYLLFFCIENFPPWDPISNIFFFPLGNNIVCDNRLKWKINSKKQPFVGGRCSAPKEYEEKLLNGFFGRGRH